MKKNAHRNAQSRLPLAYWQLAIAASWVVSAIALASTPLTPLPDPLYSFDLISPAVTQGFVEADDVLALGTPYPVTLIPGPILGLVDDADELDALSSGNVLVPANAPFVFRFSVSRASPGSAPPDPALIALGRPYNVFDQATRGQQAGDEFLSTLSFNRSASADPQLQGNNALSRNNYDEGGTDFAARPETSAHSVAGGGPEDQDNVDALAEPSAATNPYFSASGTSPSLVPLSGLVAPSGGNIFRSNLTVTSLFASYDDLGLLEDDDIDALVVFDANGDGIFNTPDEILFSLAPNSPSLITIEDASASGATADVFLAAPGVAPRLFASAVNLGLGAPLDDIDALEILPCVDPIACIEEHAIRSIPGDFDGDADVDAQDLSRFLDCLGGGTLSYPSACSPGDFDADADVDCADWSGFADAWTEPGLPPSQPKCSVSIPAVPFAKRMIIVALLLYAGACVFQGSSKRASAQGT